MRKRRWLELLLRLPEFYVSWTGRSAGRIATSGATYALLMTLFWCLLLCFVVWLAGALFFRLLFLGLVIWVWLIRHLV